MNQKYQVKVHDISTLNQSVLAGTASFAKVSAITAMQTLNSYIILPVGAAWGGQNGPALVSKYEGNKTLASTAIMNTGGVALPGEATTAAWLFHNLFPEVENFQYRHFALIAEKIAAKEVRFGVIINETGRNLAKIGLQLQTDLGQQWEKKHGFSVPLGCLVAHRDLPAKMIHSFVSDIRDSMNESNNNRESVIDLALTMAQEKDRAALEQHIDLYVRQDAFELSATAQSAFLSLYKFMQNHPHPLLSRSHTCEQPEDFFW